jgi:hypothetical protein
MQYRVNEHLLFCSQPPRITQRLVMNSANERPTHHQFEPQYAVHGMAQDAAETPPKPNAADRLYQLAALTAGIFLLATLL